MPKGGTRTSADVSGGELNGDFFEDVFDGVVCEEAFFSLFVFIFWGGDGSCVRCWFVFIFGGGWKWRRLI